ncbi:nucleotide exchange factor GrpE [Marinisporobacter balticus]|uniref:Protein GrpE n=1 Tax=Marinisporobacter balticus TaxID=2018667 RepID=A0A4R2LKY4_9FIRM|nr:nucleotide exchange factor GrpE [Marinisporobacter balticus]TCO80055.1 molecular chaperone GrpE [Marinisporobacter balticus]
MEEMKENETKMDEPVESNLDATKEEMNECSMEFEKIKEENKELNNKYLRMTADFQNYRKRAEKEKSDIYNFANEKLMIDLLPTIDNLERAMQSYTDEGKDASLAEGMEMILKQFLDVCHKNGVEEIEAMKKEFDPNYHHAVMQEENDDYDANIIIDVFQKGYTLFGKVIRPSMVKVSK